MSLSTERLRCVLYGPLSGQWPSLPLYLSLLAVADENGLIRGDPGRIRYAVAFPAEAFDLGIAELQRPDPIARFPEDANGYIVVTERPDWLRIQISAYRRYVENPRPSLPEWRAIRARIFDRDGHACVYCGSISSLECDHITPVSKGGSNFDENLATACKPCNRSKRARSLRDWRPDLVPQIEKLGLKVEADRAR